MVFFAVGFVGCDIVRGQFYRWMCLLSSGGFAKLASNAPRIWVEMWLVVKVLLGRVGSLPPPGCLFVFV